MCIYDRAGQIEFNSFDNGFMEQDCRFVSNVWMDVLLCIQKIIKNAFDVDELDAYLKEDHDFKYATVVHCDTPSGMLNDIHKICPLLKSYGIMTVTDSV